MFLYHLELNTEKYFLNIFIFSYIEFFFIYIIGHHLNIQHHIDFIVNFFLYIFSFLIKMKLVNNDLLVHSLLHIFDCCIKNSIRSTNKRENRGVRKSLHTVPCKSIHFP